MVTRARDHIINYITINGKSTEVAVVADVVSKGFTEERSLKVIRRMTDFGKLIESDGKYSLPV